MSDHDWESKAPPLDLGGYDSSKARARSIELPFETVVMDPERGGPVTFMVAEDGHIEVRDCFGTIQTEPDDAMALAQAIVEAVRRKVERLRKQLDRLEQSR